MTVKNGRPADFLREALEELGPTQAECARAIGVSPMRISHGIKATCPVTAELALLFGRVFGQSPQYWQAHMMSIEERARRQAPKKAARREARRRAGGAPA